MIRILLLLITFLSAFLLFVIQPLFAKYLLPFYGGTSSVWTISVFFYSTVLLLGYLYAAVILAWPKRIGLYVHGALIVLVSALVLERVLFGSSIFIEAAPHTVPAVSVLLTLLAAVGLPVLLLASTSVIVQRLWGDVVHADPYRLYALSNVGSLLGLLSYPFFLEAFTSLRWQGVWWSLLFILFGWLLVSVWRQAVRMSVVATQPVAVLGELKQRWVIVALASIPTFLLTAITEYVSKGIASFPMLWVIPLVLYLLSFVVGFDERRVLIGHLPLYGWIALSFIPLFIVFPMMNQHAVMYWLSFFYLSLTFFLVATFLHRRLYERRPAIAELGSFYVWVTVGGALGSAVVGLLLPVVLDLAIELPIALGLLGLYFGWRLCNWLTGRIRNEAVVLARVTAVVAFVTLMVVSVTATSLVTAERNFYGVVKVYDAERTVAGEQIPVRAIVNGATNHGFQARDPRFYEAAASYYGPDSGIDVALQYFTEAGTQPRTAVVGLGAGMMSAYCDDVSELAYIEINPLVVEIANDYFTYLTMCPEKTSVAIGDGRLVLEDWVAKDAGKFDVIMMDAFTDDSIPMHLLTSEAFRDAYDETLTTGGVVAFHVSNKYLRLQPPIVGAARAAGYDAAVVTTDADPNNELYLSTVWVLVANPGVVADLQTRFELEPYVYDTYVWSDEFNSVVQALSLQGSLQE